MPSPDDASQSEAPVTDERSAYRPKLGVQGPVVAWQDPWAPEASDAIMRTGTGVVIPAQDPTPSPRGFIDALTDLGAEYCVHHVVPGADNTELFADFAAAGVGLVLGNEYGNINGPFTAGTNRYDVPSTVVRDAAAAGVLTGVLYDEPEHLQMHASQYRTDAFLPQFGETTGLATEVALDVITGTVRGIVSDTHAVAPQTPVLAEHVFPILFHTLASAGMTPAPKIMKESFQPVQLAAAVGAAVQYRRDLWICADLWGPDIGPWTTRAQGFPGHSPAEFASALRLGYLFSPSHLFVENVDVLLRHRGDDEFSATEHGEVWQRFVREFVPATPLHWRFDEARADVVIVHAEDGDYGGGHQPLGNREATAPETSRSVFEAWHLLSHGSLPAHGSCMHIAGYDFPRHRLRDLPRAAFPLVGAEEATTTHPLFHASPNVLVFDETVDAATLGEPGLIVAVGSRLPVETHALLRRRAEAGATVIIASWLTASDARRSERIGAGQWVVFDDLLQDADVATAVAPHLGRADEWRQRFGDTELRITPGDAVGETLEFEVVDLAR